MKRRFWLVTVVAAPVLLVAGMLGLASPSYAKGMTNLTISGPGLHEPITVGPDTSEPPFIHDLFAESGAALVTGEGLVRRDREAPAGELGPRYTMIYSAPGTQLVQDAYPFAAAGPMTYTPPGQVVWGTAAVASGWCMVPELLRTNLVALGVPRPTASAEPAAATSVPRSVAKVSQRADAGSGSAGTDGSASTLPWWFAAIGLAAAAGFGTGTLVARRSATRRPR
ncbi:hypothetical protein [Actinopolymorpha sp. B9G3]|uniref:hypothetical protein n=1 Tax=Actinopolymorpha sp. B9G3 TaxID=3158970 RepID=UPI0032D98900